MSRPLQSISSPSNNILLKVTVPRRTGRTRKRGSNGPFIKPEGSSNDAGDGDTDRTARDFQRSLADNVGKYQIEPVGMVKRTHVFRGELPPKPCPLVTVRWTHNGQECRILSSQQAAVPSRIGSEIRSCRLIVCLCLPQISKGEEANTDR